MKGFEFEAQIKLLFVRNDADFSKSLSNRLKKNNINVITAGNAEIALKLLNNDDYDVIVSDIRLRGMDGIEFLAKVKEINQHLPVILLTGFADLQSAKDAVKLHAFDYLVKPLDNIDNLLIPIKNAVENYNLTKENIYLKEYYQTIVENIPIGIVTLDREKRIENANKAFYKIFKLFGENAIGKPYTIFDAFLTNRISDPKIKSGNKFYCIINNNTIGLVFLKHLNIKDKGNTLMVISEVDINYLSNREKEIFFKLFKQQSYAEIAKSLNIDINTVYVYKNRLKMKLKGKVDMRLWKKFQ